LSLLHEAEGLAAARLRAGERPRGLHILTTRRLDVLATRGLYVLTTRRLDLLTTRSLNVLATRRLYVLTTRRLDLLTTRSLHVLATRRLVLRTRARKRTRRLHVLTTRRLTGARGRERARRLDGVSLRRPHAQLFLGLRHFGWARRGLGLDSRRGKHGDREGTHQACKCSFHCVPSNWLGWLTGADPHGPARFGSPLPLYDPRNVLWVPEAIGGVGSNAAAKRG